MEETRFLVLGAPGLMEETTLSLMKETWFSTVRAPSLMWERSFPTDGRDIPSSLHPNAHHAFQVGGALMT